MYGNNPAGLYIHIPFCHQKCLYCDFYSITDLSLEKDFISALILEMKMIGPLPFEFDTLYLGGGTPSVLKTKNIGRIVDNVRSIFRLSSNIEITLEINPGTVGEDDFKTYRAMGINRINIGAQSFIDDHLTFLGRLHKARTTLSAVKWGRNAGFKNLGIDLIYGIPDQSEKQWRFDLQQAVALLPEHLSCYILTYEPKTPLTRKLQADRFIPMKEGRVAALFEQTLSFLKDHGFKQYEISNFSREDKVHPGNNQSRHNLKYWSFSPYIGLGPSAHSFYNHHRYWNHSSLRDYLEAVNSGGLPVKGREVLNREQLMIEAIYLGLRQTEGISIKPFEDRFGVHFLLLFGTIVSFLEEEGLIRKYPDRVSLTLKGMLLADQVVAAFVRHAIPDS